MRASFVVSIGLGLVLASASAVRAQEVEFQTVDRVAAIVGDSVISLSRVEEELNVYRQRGGEIPTDPDQRTALMRELLNGLVEQQLVLQAALRDTSITVSEQEVQVAVERAVREVRGQFASELEFRRELESSNFGTPEEYRLWLADQQRNELLRNQYIQKLREKGDLTPLAPTEAELRTFYEENRNRQQRRPATASFRQIVVRVDPDSAALATAFHLADSLAGVLRDGADFNVIARRFSEDPGSRDQGGELGWVRRGNFVPRFEAVAFSIKPGAISPPVLTPFGYHIIEVERSQPAEVQVRHILIRPTLTEADAGRARGKAELVAQGLIDGVPFDSLAALYHDFVGSEQTLIEDYPQSELPEMYRDALSGAQPNDIIGPMLIDAGDGRPKFAVIRVLELRPEGEYSFDDLRDQMRNVLSEQNAMQRMLRTLREATYVEIRL
jgi:peptidyl-prolyl cis-trans isomerase SurA